VYFKHNGGFVVQLKGLQIKAGAIFDEENGGHEPLQYGDKALEYQTAKNGAGIIDRSLRGKLRLTGKDRARFIHGMVTNTVEGLGEGAGNHAALTSVKGQTFLDLWVSNLGDCLWLETEPAYQTKLNETLDRYLIADDVVITDETDAWVILGVVGPKADEVVNVVFCGGDPLPEHYTKEIEWAGTPVWITRRSIFGGAGFDIRSSVSVGGAVWQALLDAGGTPIGSEMQEILRVEAGTPRCGVEIDESVAPLEAGLSDTVDFDKGCYIGQEVIAKMHFRGKPRRYLVGVEVDGDEILEPNTDIVAENNTVGRITSCVYSPQLDRVIALAIVRRGMHDVGQCLQVGDIAVKVVVLPFVTRND
jgi:tRNA-modifying protein YgfZ